MDIIPSETVNNQMLLHIEIDKEKHLKIATGLKEKKDLINLLTDIIKIVNNKEESNIIIPGRI
ncbi:MAG: hypothetical protein V1901_04355 [Patescibacteria group bacterium]